MAMLRGDPTGLFVFHFDVKKFGEASSRPDVRCPPLKDGPYHRLVRCLLQARTRGDMPAALGPGEVAVLLDGGKSGNASRLLAPWKEETRAAGAGKRKERTEDDDDDDDAEEEDEEDDERGKAKRSQGLSRAASPLSTRR